MDIEESKQDSQSEEEDLPRATFPDCSNDYIINTDPFIKNITTNAMYPGEWFELEAENLFGYVPDSLASCVSSPVYAEYMRGMSGTRNMVSRQEGANDMEPSKKAEISRGTILVVSKDHLFLDSLHSILGDLGYHVIPAEIYGYGLMDVVNEIMPNLAIIDIGMPSMTGIRTTLLLRIHTAIPTILLTKWQTDSNTFRKLDVNNPDALSGPITSDELVNLVKSTTIWHEDINL